MLEFLVVALVEVVIVVVVVVVVVKEEEPLFEPKMLQLYPILDHEQQKEKQQCLR
jgi:hypothetical protein